jgi:tetraacyldisaccharide 4'-kinase
MNLHPILRWLLWPFSLLYGAAVLLRAWLYRKGLAQQKRLNGIVISVGNLTTGGTGKTPLVICLAEQLHRDGRKVAVLTRGYRKDLPARPLAIKKMFVFFAKAQRGLIERTVRRAEGRDPYEDTTGGAFNCDGQSDEVQVLSASLPEGLPIGVSANRHAIGKELAERGYEWFLLDDGFQHQRLARDADILLIDARDPFGSGHLLPAGRLREPKSAMRRADLIVITRSEHAPALESVIRRYTPAPVFYATTELKEIYLEGRGTGDQRTADWLGKRMFVFCGIGNPAAFVENVGHWGMDVAGHMAFRDHHRYIAADLAEIERRATAAGAEALICTEKDSYNLGDARPRELPLYVCRIATRLADPARFWQTLYDILELKRR